jgi:hypothetical protein
MGTSNLQNAAVGRGDGWTRLSGGAAWMIGTSPATTPKCIFLPNAEIGVIPFAITGSNTRLAGTRSSKAKGDFFYLNRL